jgi:hypothetical protein
MGWQPRSKRPTPGVMARLYPTLLGWPIGHQEPATTIIATSEGPSYLVFQQATGYPAPVWAPVDGNGAR